MNVGFRSRELLIVCALRTRVYDGPRPLGTTSLVKIGQDLSRRPGWGRRGEVGEVNCGRTSERCVGRSMVTTTTSNAGLHVYEEGSVAVVYLMCAQPTIDLLSAMWCSRHGRVLAWDIGLVL